MLTSDQDFVQDSFKVAATDSLEALKVGDLSVWIEPGPYAIVAAVIRGSAPAGYRARLQEAVETIHLQFGAVLEAFDGDTSGLADAKSTLESCLHAEFRADERKPRTRSTWVIASLILIALLVWGGFRWREIQALGRVPRRAARRAGHRRFVRRAPVARLQRLRSPRSARARSAKPARAGGHGRR
jgi:OOP family OmpA-OmpF porin